MIDLGFLEREMSMAKICDAERVQEQKSEKLNLKCTSLFVRGGMPACASVCQTRLLCRQLTPQFMLNFRIIVDPRLEWVKIRPPVLLQNFNELHSDQLRCGGCAGGRSRVLNLYYTVRYTAVSV